MLLKTAWMSDDTEELAVARRDLRQEFRRHIQGGVEK
jgi:hypothetical protein